ncbi:MAG: AAA family ATPase [bacterium]|nr:AAA family ATPase [bacterium]
MERRITDDMYELRRSLPPHLNAKLDEIGHGDDLLEIVLDLGRIPTARFTFGEQPLSNHEVTRTELDAIVNSIGSFDADNRAGIERTLHRISAIRNRNSAVIGLTCRIGRAVYGTIDIIQDLVESGQSILILGPPGVGKTTMLRESARVLAESRRVVIVDTSNEIGGDGDVPHPAVGKARRMQVSHPERQHEVMIEAVENHNPEVIVIDEIGRELEAMAARTIAERGVQLIGTAHGNALDNLLLNPTLSDLVGGIQAVTLSDEEARKRGTQKTVLERKAPPTFDVLLELQTRDRLVVHEDVSGAVDLVLRDKPLPIEIRYRNEQGEIVVETATTDARSLTERRGERTTRSGERNGARPRKGDAPVNGEDRPRAGRAAAYRDLDSDSGEWSPAAVPSEGIVARDGKAVRVYAFGVARNRLQQSAKRLHVPVVMVDDPGQVDMIVTLKNYYRRRPKLIVDAERRGTPIYVLRANTVTQMENFLIELFQKGDSDDPNDPVAQALNEARDAIARVRNGGLPYVDLRPQVQTIRRAQHEMVRMARLESESHGNEPERYVRVLRKYED